MLPPNSSPLSQNRKYAMRLHTAFRCGLPKRCVFLGWHVLTERLCRDRLAASRKRDPEAKTIGPGSQTSPHSIESSRPPRGARVHGT